MFRRQFAMRCPSCGALHDESTTCQESELLLLADSTIGDDESSEIEAFNLEMYQGSEEPFEDLTKDPNKTVSRLLEFPGTHAVPAWRKEVAERVREAQERRAREAAAEASAATARTKNEEKDTPQLELLTPTEEPELNPLVAAALKRIERAYCTPNTDVNRTNRPIAAVAYATDSSYRPLIEATDRGPVSQLQTSPLESVDASPVMAEETSGLRGDSQHESERSHNLVIVPSPGSSPDSEAKLPSSSSNRSSRRLLSDDVQSPALNYLDRVQTALRVENATNTASSFRRITAAMLDLVVMVLFCSPIFAAVELTGADWRSPAIIAFALITFLVFGFLYSTISTALTGRTLAMRWLQLRVVDARTGLIPTGSQAAGRAFLYLLSILSAGTLLAFVLLDTEHRLAHDRFTRTLVIAV
jgi:uncharacterized RDD family membrane protein YckC